MKHSLSQIGFTLIELIVVLAIISIIALMTPTFYTRFLLQSNTQNTTDQLVGSLRKAQIYSMMGRLGSSWSVHIGNGKIILYQGSTFNTRNSGLDESFNIAPNINILGLTDITFNRLNGTPVIFAPLTVTVSSNLDSKSITINTQGTVIRN